MSPCGGLHACVRRAVYPQHRYRRPEPLAEVAGVVELGAGRRRDGGPGAAADLASYTTPLALPNVRPEGDEHALLGNVSVVVAVWLLPQCPDPVHLPQLRTCRRQRDLGIF